MDPFTQDILSQSAGSHVSPELLETLGRQASQTFQQKGTPLNQAIRELTAQHPELGNEHIKRIVEFANNVTFQDKFQNGADKNVHFEVADPGVVLRDLKDGGSPAHDGRSLESDYLSPPKQSGNDATALDNLIWPSQDSGTAKLASQNLSLDELFDSKLQLQGVFDKLAESYEVAGYLLDEAKESLYSAIKNEVVRYDGAGLGGVVGALTKIASEDLVASFLPAMIERMREEGFQPQQLQSSFEKRAGVMVNPDHPLVISFQGMMKIAQEMVVVDDAMSKTDKELVFVKTAMRKLAGPVTSGVRDAVNHRGKLPPAIRQRFSRV